MSVCLLLSVSDGSQGIILCAYDNVRHDALGSIDGYPD
jgi:hypothetical protein